MLVPNKRYLYYAIEFTSNIPDIVIVSNYQQYLDARYRRDLMRKYKRKGLFYVGRTEIEDDWPLCHR